MKQQTDPHNTRHKLSEYRVVVNIRPPAVGISRREFCKAEHASVDNGTPYYVG